MDERLIQIETHEEASYIESENDWDTFFRTMVGVRRESHEVEKVVLKFYNGRERYFKTKPFIPDFEEFFEDEKQDQVWFETIINKELIQQILSYGKDVEVLGPNSLREQMKGYSEVMESYYGN